ncbi:MAG: PAS domain-containing sensor histidine kinase [Pseudomonadota bacterium]
MKDEAPHYLEQELNELLRTDSGVMEFLCLSVCDGLWYWDLENPEHEWMSESFWQLFGVDPALKSHKAHEWQDIIDAGDLALALENFKRHCADPSQPYDQVVRYRHADGSTIWVRCRGLAIRDKSGRPIRMLGAHTDLTRQILATERMKAEADAARHATRELRALTYAFSHDMKTPANSLKLLLSEIEIEAGADPSPDMRELLRLSQGCVDNMAELSDSLLEYSALLGDPSGQQTVATEALLRDVVAGLAPEDRADITVGHLPKLMGERDQLRLMFRHLIDNALKFHDRRTPRQVSIVEGPSRSSDHVHIKICDNGIGIAEAHRDRVFDMFYRLHTRSDYPGKGLGLAICARVARNHSGKIIIESDPGRGTEVSIWLRGAEG